MATIFLVDDDELVVKSLLRVLRGPNNVLHPFPSAASALARIDEKPDVLICDYRLHGMDGLELCARARERHPGVKTIVLSGVSGDPAIDAALRAGRIDGFLAKPWMNDDLVASVEKLLRA